MKKIGIIALCVMMFLVSGCGTETAVGNSEKVSVTEITIANAEADKNENMVAEDTREASDIIREIILYYGYHQENAENKINELFEELKTVSEEKYELWSEVYDYWKHTNGELQVNYGKLPDDLPLDDSLCLVALGYKLNADGSIQDELEGRLQVLLDCANQYPNAYVVCTGGGTASANADVTEAGQMASWLIDHGISEERIIVEDSSLTTAQNAINTYNILKEQYPQVDTVAIVSSDYHIGWGSVLFQAEFMVDGDSQISVVSNAASDPETPEDYPFNFQAAGLLEIADDDKTAWEIYQYRFDESSLNDLD